MLKETEEKALNIFTELIRTNPSYRSVAMDQGELIHKEFNTGNLFFIFKGSYMTRNCLLGVTLQYGLPDERIDTPISVVYCIKCSSLVDAYLVKEKISDRVTKEIGLQIEIEVGNQSIDDHYLIKSSTPRLFTPLCNVAPLKDFLIRHKDGLDLFRISEGFIEFRRGFHPLRESTENIQKDLEDLIVISEQIEKTA